MFSQIPKRSPFTGYRFDALLDVSTDLQSELRARIEQFSFAHGPTQQRIILHIFVPAIVVLTAAIGTMAHCPARLPDQGVVR